jgi:hypothetical protein
MSLYKYLNPLIYIKFLKSGFLKFSNTTIHIFRYFIFNLNKLKLRKSDDLINLHFDYYSDPVHYNFAMFHYLLGTFKSKPLQILETGSSAHGIYSSHLFIDYIKKFGGNFYTVDINPDVKELLSKFEGHNINIFTSDSVRFIKLLDKDIVRNLDIVYLDSFDLDLMNPEPSENHGLNEFINIYKDLKVGCLVAIDDTPSDYSYFLPTKGEVKEEYRKQIKKNGPDYIPGKGRKILDLIASLKNFEVIFHEYAVILKKIN